MGTPNRTSKTPSKLDFCHFEVAENTVFSGVSYVTAGFLHDIVSATEANKSANTRFFQHVHTYCESKNGKSRAETGERKSFWTDGLRMIL
jgi:hypothetical protein